MGQRRGLGIGGLKGKTAASWFVVGKDVHQNRLYVAQGEENEYLLSDRAIITRVNWMDSEIPKIPLHVGCKFRYRQKDQGVVLKFIGNDRIELIFDQPYKAVTPGQAAVFYSDNRCLGGGIIDEIYYRGRRK